MSDDRWDALLDRDWSSSWDTLPEAPPLVERGKTSQITLRLSAGLLARAKRVASTRSLPYHVLMRSWLVDALRQTSVPPGELPVEAHTEQLNIKLDQDLLDRLKAAARDLERPYHRLAREWIDVAVAREEEALGLNVAPTGGPGIKDLMVLLLHATDSRGQEAVRGITRLQKLLFVLEQTVGGQGGRFYAYNFGPFDEGVHDAAKALELAGFLTKGSKPAAGIPSFGEMIAAASGRAGPQERPQPQEFALSEQGHAAAERLLQSSQAYAQLFARVRELRGQWDTPELLERVYEEWPEYAEQSMIKDEVAARRARRRKENQ
jgi:predicted DNA binding CopG/RHH family protein